MKGANELLILAFLLILASSSSPSSSSAVNSEPDDGKGQWQMLTNHNFSTQIRLHPHILFIVSYPWSGESRFLMKELSDLVRVYNKEDELNSLKFMYMHRNKDQMLADAIGASDGLVTVLYYHYSFAYKYQGRLIASNVLSSVVPYLNVSSRAIPIKEIGNQEELENFTESTDKAVLLLESCGWTAKLMASMDRNRTQNGDFSGVSSEGEADEIPEAQLKENLKGTETASSMCGIQDIFGGVPSIAEFSPLLNSSGPFQDSDTEDMKHTVGLSSCSYKEFQQFKSFFFGFMNVARELFLLSEKYRFGLVSDKSLLSSLGAGDSGSWSTMVYFNGCPSCSKILKEGDDLRDVLLLEESIVLELEANGQDIDPAVPANKPSVILFVDRFSNSSDIKKKSKEALGELRKLALEYHISDEMHQQNGKKFGRPSTQSFQEYRSKSGHPKLRVYPAAQKLKLEENMSIMIVNEGKSVILDKLDKNLQGSSLHEILTHILQKKKEAKLSSVAKEAGFQLLSDDIDIKLSDTLPSEHTEEPIQDSDAPYEEGIASTGVNLDKDQNERIQLTDIKDSIHDDEEKKTYVDTSKFLLSLKPDQLESDDGLAILDGLKTKEKGFTQVDRSEKPLPQFQSFKGSFYFSDGNHRLLRALTGESRIPSLVIIDPILQQHYVFPKQTDFSYASLEDVLHEFLNGVLIPYQHSESKPENPREGTHPPFVNMDFHEADSIPRVTAQTFSEQVLGSSKSGNNDISPAWKEDVVVLFSNSWCGFCQRMELVVREVFRALKGYMKVVKAGSRTAEVVLSDDNLKNAVVKFPKIFLIDCTLNDCSLILNSSNQREVYPALLLFPAERKTAVSYEGDIGVANVIKFIADHGSCSQHLTSNKGNLF
ncbi:uncharacterized protein LOC126681161 isoform X2 [Mercurialis annua]|uniref:uncharacterized protein LOC126681161 isoform X2 n=1 Tax=Mercurialis annua TaxID=3986 RepID=UPI00216075A4|nr:uncharacterized protein LOC126681161 isoform X2 [Mercurialis annua]